ncbi:hypothetical protein Ntsu_39510 [Nocardia sp. IFM 10818]
MPALTPAGSFALPLALCATPTDGQRYAQRADGPVRVQYHPDGSPRLRQVDRPSESPRARKASDKARCPIKWVY